MPSNQESQSHRQVFIHQPDSTLFRQGPTPFLFPAFYQISQSLNPIHGNLQISQTIHPSNINDTNSGVHPHHKITKNTKSTKSRQISRDSRKFDNTMSSNYLRILVQCLKETLGVNHVVYTKLFQFMSKFSIKKQVWGFEAILTFIMFMRDQTSLLSHQDKIAIKKRIVDKISNQVIKISDSEIRQRRMAYKRLAEEFLSQSIGFGSLGELKDVRASFYDTIVKKKRTINVRCLFVLEHIKESFGRDKQLWSKESMSQGIKESKGQGIDREQKAYDGLNFA